MNIYLLTTRLFALLKQAASAQGPSQTIADAEPTAATPADNQPFYHPPKPMDEIAPRPTVRSSCAVFMVCFAIAYFGMMASTLFAAPINKTDPFKDEAPFQQIVPTAEYVEKDWPSNINYAFLPYWEIRQVPKSAPLAIDLLKAIKEKNQLNIHSRPFRLWGIVDGKVQLLAVRLPDEGPFNKYDLLIKLRNRKLEHGIVAVTTPEDAFSRCYMLIMRQKILGSPKEVETALNNSTINADTLGIKHAIDIEHLNDGELKDGLSK